MSDADPALSIPEVPTKLPSQVVKSVDESELSNTEDLKRKAREQNLKHRDISLKALVDAWNRQQEQDRETRRNYAKRLLGILIAQIFVINLAFFLMGWGLLKVQEGTAKTFIISTFLEISSLVLIVVKYLFPVTSDKVLEVIDRLNLELSNRPKRTDSHLPAHSDRARKSARRPK
jgi:hypothetical protein